MLPILSLLRSIYRTFEISPAFTYCLLCVLFILLERASICIQNVGLALLLLLVSLHGSPWITFERPTLSALVSICAVFWLRYFNFSLPRLALFCTSTSFMSLSFHSTLAAFFWTLPLLSALFSKSTLFKNSGLSLGLIFRWFFLISSTTLWEKHVLRRYYEAGFWRISTIQIAHMI